MATQNLTTITAIVKSALNDTSTTIISDAEIAIIANDGSKDVASKSMCYEATKTITLVSGTSSYRIPTTTQVAFKVNYVDHNGRGLIKILPTIIGRAGTVSAGVGTPQTWFQWGDTIIIDPPPNSTAAAISPGLTIYCSCYPSAEITSTINDIPTEFHESILDFALAFSMIKTKRWGDLARYYNIYIDNIQRKRLEYIHKMPDTRADQNQPNSVEIKFGEDNG